ncbi:type II secretion system F family protein [Parendozoicomonas sp. Alg238-R29]|uniref:type II secretion system F family protein n=1 Tax=Parendozoicomonas sp. Alg238-R29 TaxID=2993446 RepID=UPI00248EBFAD|nr:type II secretion system F family protein [Parendozoicomonas sp. Alg238-R29]
MIWLAVLFVAVFSLLAVALWPHKNPIHFLTDTRSQKTVIAKQVLDVKALTEQPLLTQIKNNCKNLKDTLGKYVYVTLAVYITVNVTASLWLHDVFPRVPLYTLLCLLFCTTAFVLLTTIKQYRQKSFEDAFPDALRTLTGAVSSGESLHQSIAFVGNSLNNLVGREFRSMGQKLALGHTMEDVLMSSCQRFPYPVFVFFVLTLRANASRGGQLKTIFKNLEEVMLNNQTLQKKMKALTSEVRMSAKIIGALPPGFFLFMKYVSPENFDFVVYNPAGQIILMYVIGSEVLGILVIWWLMRQVRG